MLGKNFDLSGINIRFFFFSGSFDQTAMLWEWKIDSNSIDCINIYKGHERNIESIGVSPDKQLFASCGWDTMLKIWSSVGEDYISGENGEPKSKRAKKDVKSLTKVTVLIDDLGLVFVNFFLYVSDTSYDFKRSQGLYIMC